MKEFVLITGQSGAGKSQAAGILEDMGYYCVDNLPAELLPSFIQLCLAAEGRFDRVALVSDIRGQTDFGELAATVARLREELGLHVLYLEASDAAILNRYKETRHSHPLDPGGEDLPAAIRREKEALAPLRAEADTVVDTTGFTWSRLKLRLSKVFHSGKEEGGLFLHICSFGFKNGLPAGADLVFDVRFLPNPFYVPELKNLTGMDAPVREYVDSFPAAGEFRDKLRDLLAFLLPRYQEEGKSSLQLAFGCTGGRHRSVALAEEVTVMLRGMGYSADCVHRDLK